MFNSYIYVCLHNNINVSLLSNLCFCNLCLLMPTQYLQVLIYNQFEPRDPNGVTAKNYETCNKVTAKLKLPLPFLQLFGVECAVTRAGCAATR